MAKKTKKNACRCCGWPCEPDQTECRVCRDGKAGCECLVPMTGDPNRRPAARVSSCPVHGFTYLRIGASTRLRVLRGGK